MAIRAPSCASRTASPRPMPRLPPVTSATRFRSDIFPANPLKVFQYSLREEVVLPQPRDDDRHIIGLFRSARPLFRGGHERFRNHQWLCALYADGRILQSRDSKLLAIHVFRLNQAIAVANQQ